MKRSFVLGSLVVCIAASVACAQTEAPTSQAPVGEPTELADKVAYSMGARLGASLKQQSVDLNLAFILRGLEDAMGDGELLLTDQEMATAVQEFQMQIVREQQDKNRTEGEAFLASNAQREEVTTLPSGLQYEIVQAGDGAKPAATDRVTVHYRGSLIDGTQFDSSYDRGQPATFRLDQVIAGWTEGLQQMNVGSIWKLYIPSELAYGESPPPGPIGPNATLVFVVELIGIE